MASWTALRLKIEPIDSPETSVTKFQTTLRNILEIEDPHLVQHFDRSSK